jgi:hypothetical protein
MVRVRLLLSLIVLSPGYWMYFPRVKAAAYIRVGLLKSRKS